ncbi:MAG TPA: hypothetical protein VLA72_13255 [Anaerolineales bacterium]|nr:hypothetical protein [Anaerolineales bacterium]
MQLDKSPGKKGKMLNSTLKSQSIKVTFLAILVLFLIVLGAKLVPSLFLGYDWIHTYRPAALAMARGESPYTVDIYYAAPWALLPLIPIALLPKQAGIICIFLLGLSAFAYTAYKLGAKPVSMIIFLLSASVVGCLLWGNIEWMPLLAIVLPAPIGLIFAVIKPQVGIGIVIYWLFKILKTEGFKSVIKAFLPVTILTLLSFWMYGLWPLRFQQTLDLSNSSSLDYNSTIWPQGAFIGIWLLYKAIKSHHARTAMAASPFLSPYTLQYTWVAVLVSVINKPMELLIISIGLWIPVALRFVN